jgi:hypothetical protein
VKLYQAIKGRAWEDDTAGKLFQQLKGIGVVAANKLLSGKFRVFRISIRSVFTSVGHPSM